MKPPRRLALAFQPALDALASRKALCDGLSAVLQSGRALWVANDESATVERLTLSAEGRADQHKQFALHDFLNLPLPPEGDPPEAPEVDIEGLDQDGGYLWLVGSHSLKRSKPGKDHSPKAARAALANLTTDGNRYLLARIPLVEDAGPCALARTHEAGGQTRTAARLRGRRQGNELMAVLRQDKHLGAFIGLPGKENGFDIEGLAVRGDRVFLGLRGPVLRGWAVILELRVGDGRQSGRLKLLPLDDKGRRVRKHFLALDGRGVRDIHLDGDDLLILAGPTMDLDGTISVLRWPGALRGETGCVVPASQLQHVMDLPHGKGCDRAEGITLFTPPGSTRPPALLVVHDAAASSRQQEGSVLLADVFEMPSR